MILLLHSITLASFFSHFHLDLTHVEGWLESGGYVLLFGLLFACGLGLPLPEDVPLIASGILISQHHMHVAIAAPLAWLGIIGGDCCLYYFGHKYGHNITRVPMIGTHVTLKRLEQAERWFEKYGVWVVAVGRLFAGIRGAMVIAAGAARFNFFKFIVADSIAAVFSGGMFMALGWWFGSNLGAMERHVHQFKTILIFGGIALAIGLTLFFWWRGKRRRENEENAPSGNAAVEQMRQPVPAVPETIEEDPRPEPRVVPQEQ